MAKGKVYIPMDWRRAIASGTPLSVNQEGATLFADISGFTPLTEAFALELGPKRGGEELTIHLNRVYDGIISVLHDYQGSVISFSGDSITCWFDQDLDGRQAVTCALEMQTAMAPFSTIKTKLGREFILGLKVSVAIGTVKRFTVGMPDYKIHDAMAGKTVERMANAEGFASAGDVVIDSATAKALEPYLEIAQWHTDEDDGQKYASITGLNLQVEKTAWDALDEANLSYEKVDEWLLPTVASRINSGLGDFLTELRPAATIFLRFTGLDYDHDDDAPSKLGQFVQNIQRILLRLEGSLIQLTIGDKGSYLYAAFGAPVAHENDVERAALAAIAFREESKQFDFIDSIQIGISHGLMRTGAYGGRQRRTYGVLGDHVNLSARLMSKAPHGEIYVSQVAYRKISKAFNWEQLQPMMVKGKSQPIQVFRLIDSKQHQTIRLTEPEYSLPMVGRQEELSLINEKIDSVLEGKGQIIGITAEAGMGKSRLTAELIKNALEKGMVGFGGECQSFGTNTSYLVWQAIWQAFFNLDRSIPQSIYIDQLTSEIELVDPSLVYRIPLLAPLLQLEIKDNDLTLSLDAKTRKSSLETFLIDVLHHRSMQKPVLLVLEDSHWMDPLSSDLVEEIGKAIESLPVLMVLVYRPPDANRLQLPKVYDLPYFTSIELKAFDRQESEHLIELKINQFFGDKHVPNQFKNLLIQKAAGNPFYLDEIINFIQDQELNPEDSNALSKIELPNTIYSLVLSRIDNLSESQKMALKVASVIGRLFKAAMVWGIYPTNEETTMIREDLEHLSEMDLTPLDEPEPELTYLFKHIVTREVAYESLPFAARANLHGQIGYFIEVTQEDELDQNLDLLAYHYGLSNDIEKKTKYWLKAGMAAKNNYANGAAIDYFSQVIPLLSGEEEVRVQLELGEVYQTIGEWEKAEALFDESIQEADTRDYEALQIDSRIKLAEMRRSKGQYNEAVELFSAAEEKTHIAKDDANLAKILICMGTLNAQQGKFDDALNFYNRSLAINEQLGNNISIANVYNNMAIVAEYQGDIEKSHQFHSNSLSTRREMEDQFGIATSLSNLGYITISLGDYDTAKNYLEEAITLQRAIGNKWNMANTMNNLGNAHRELNAQDEASKSYAQSLQLFSELGDKWALAFLLEDIGMLLAQSNSSVEAITLASAADKVRSEIDSPLSESLKAKLDSSLAPSRENLGDEADKAWELGQTMEVVDAVALASNSLNG